MKRSKKIDSEESALRVLDLLIALAALKNQGEVANFVADLLTESEIEVLATRLRIARRLLEGKTLDQVVADLKTGKNTAAKVARWLETRGEGFRQAVGHLPPEKPLESRDKSFYDDLRRRYRSYFVLYEALDSLFKDRGPDKEPAERLLAQLREKKKVTQEIDKTHRQA